MFNPDAVEVNIFKTQNALKRLQANPQQSIQDAEFGSIHDLSAISYGIYELPSHLHSSIFDMVKVLLYKKLPKLDHLEGQNIRNVLRGFSDRIPLRFHMIGQLHMARFFGTEERQLLIADLWPDIFRWMKCLRELSSLVQHSAEGSSPVVYMLGIKTIFVTICSCEHIRESILGDAEVFRFVAELWANPGTSLEIGENAAEALICFDPCLLNTPSPSDVFEEI